MNLLASVFSTLGHRLGKNRCVTSAKKLSHSRRLSSKSRSRENSSFGITHCFIRALVLPWLCIDICAKLNWPCSFLPNLWPGSLLARNARVQIYQLRWSEVPQNQTELAFFALPFLVVMPFLNLRMLRLLAGNIGLCTSVVLKKIIMNQFQLINILDIACFTSLRFFTSLTTKVLQKWRIWPSSKRQIVIPTSS